MPTFPVIFCIAEFSLSISHLVLLFWFSSSSDACFRTELTVSTSSTLAYQAIDKQRWIFNSLHKIDVNIYCEVLFRASQGEDMIRLEVTESNLKQRLFGSSQCLDVVTVYDGSSFNDAILGDFCDVSMFQSSGSSALLVFSTSKLLAESYRGFILSYSSINRYEEDKSRPSVSLIALAVISAALLFCVFFLVLYKRCCYPERVRRNLVMSGHIHGDLRAAMAARQRAPLNQGEGQPNDNGFSSPIPEILTSLNVPSRPESAHGSQRTGRVRHPAGGHPPSQHHQLTVLYSSHPSVLSDNCSGYGSDRDEPSHRVNPALSAVVGHTQHFIPVVTTDPTGVFYAGNIDEHGILHPPGDQKHLTISVAPSVVSAGHARLNTGYHMEDSHKSRESSHSCRSLCPSDINSSHGSSHDGSSRCGSAYTNRISGTKVVYSGSAQLLRNMNSEGETFTFYGMIDVDSAATSSGATVIGDREAGSSDSDGGASSLHNEDTRLCGPPPSYEDAASGKYSAHFPKQ